MNVNESLRAIAGFFVLASLALGYCLAAPTALRHQRESASISGSPHPAYGHLLPSDPPSSNCGAMNAEKEFILWDDFPG